MPTQTPQVPTTFASAAANGPSDGSAGGRGGGSGEWSKTRPNGATATFRRPSQVNTTAGHVRESSQQNNPTPSSGVYVPPHMNSSFQSATPRVSSTTESRYSKEQLLDFYRANTEPRSLSNVSDILTEGWSPGTTNAANNGGWSRESRDQNHVGAEICWDSNGAVQPLGTIEMGDEEKELFTSSVNSPIKPPQPNAGKEVAQTPGLNGRKTSFSQAQVGGGTFGGTAQNTRPGTRRRETSDSITGLNPLASPNSFNRSSRDDAPISTPPPSLLRRRTDFKDNIGSSFGDRTRLDSPLDTSSPFGSFKRPLGPMSAGLNGPSSPWAPGSSSAGFGAFAGFNLDGTSGQPATPGEKKVGFGSLRGESRFKGLMSKESTEDLASKTKDKAASGLKKLPESEAEQQTSRWEHGRTRKETNPFDDLAQHVGSAALGGDEQSNDHRRMHDDIGFSSFGTSSDLPHLRDVLGHRDVGPQETPLHQQYSSNPNEPMSPTDTNPYQSPEAGKIGPGYEMDDLAEQSSYDISGHNQRTLNAHDGGDRSQTSSVGAARGFPPLSGLGAFGGSGPWSAAPGAIGTTNRGNQGFLGGLNDPIFGSMGDIQSPSTSVFGAQTAGAFGSIGRSKMGSLFPTQMQDQMRPGDVGRSDHVFGDMAPSRNTTTAGFAQVDSSSHANRDVLDDLFGGLDNRSRGLGGMSMPFNVSESAQSAFSQGPSMSSAQSFSEPYASTASATPSVAASSNNTLFGRGADVGGSAGLSNQIPATQQRQMVMPDRMRWCYLDPNANVQGPFSGLEMHDWYKAGFFSPELQVKKQEDPEYEPLAQLIRRIGNSREPFLVPQIGIPYGAADTQTSGVASVLGVANPAIGTQAGPAQPPFASSFPSFGTTLTAEQQNALERRKQEEQYLMARQKEHLAQHQVLIKQRQMQGIPHGVHPQQLHHHSSAHSLQSQPSYGSITSPAAYQTPAAPLPLQQVAGVLPGMFDAARAGIGSTMFPNEGIFQGRETELPSALDRLNLNRGMPSSYGGMPPQNHPENMNHQQQVAAMLQDRAQLQSEQERFDATMRDKASSGRESLERFEQYQQLRADEDEQPTAHGGVIGRPVAQEIEHSLPSQSGISTNEPSIQSSPVQVEPSLDIQSEDIADVAPQTIAPPQPSISPLPAPAAQRNRQHVAEALAADSRSRSQTPSVDTPTATLAPWAKENAEGPKGPSLKEIQEAEARKTAQQEEIAAAARRALAEQERLLSIQTTAVPAPGLPSTANWATSTSPATPTGGASAWAKPLAGKSIATPSSGAKKTLAQIQKEEEARKTRAAAAAAAATAAAGSVTASSSSTGGKRYADLASKATASAPTGIGGAWTTVGASGKAKTAAGPSITPVTTPRVASGSSAPAAKPKPAAPVRSNTGMNVNQSANDEFQKWVKGALVKGLHPNINVDDFVRDLLQFPPESDILSAAIYSSSHTLDGHRFAEEFIRRRKLADKGIAPEASANSSFATGAPSENKSAGGWSEVAKKVPASAPKEEANFKVVAAKKKGKR